MSHVFDHKVATALKDDLTELIAFHNVSGAIDRLARFQWIILILFSRGCIIFEVPKTHARASQAKLSFFTIFCFCAVIFDDIGSYEFCRETQRDPLIISDLSFHWIQECIEEFGCTIALAVAWIRNHLLHLVDQFGRCYITRKGNSSQALIQFLFIAFPC